MKLTLDNIKLIKMFNKCCFRYCWHHKRKVRKKNFARAQYILRRGNQITRHAWRKYQ